MHQKQIAGDYFLSYTTRNISAKRDKLYIIGALLSASCFINFEHSDSNINLLSKQCVIASKRLEKVKLWRASGNLNPSTQGVSLVFYTGLFISP
jgi:hypothetical protein